jgi:ubiquinone/menaquinone biosynthesis C-methylase UbiE
MLRRQEHDVVMKMAVGGAYEIIGAKEKEFLLSIGLKPNDYVVDVGCGSGRLSTALRDTPSLRYLGTDVVPDLIEYAVTKCARPDWKFRVVQSLTIPERDSQADMIVFFSVFTHLTPRECFDYLCEANRVVKPNGQIVVSFLDRTEPYCRSVAGNWIFATAARICGRGVKNTLLNQDDLRQWGIRLGLEYRFNGIEAFGQAVCVYRKPLQRFA